MINIACSLVHADSPYGAGSSALDLHFTHGKVWQCGEKLSHGENKDDYDHA